MAAGCVLIFSACCSVPYDSHDLAILMHAYNRAQREEVELCRTAPNCDAVRARHYEAAAALTVAMSSPDGCSVEDARKAVAAFVAAVQP